MFLFIYQTTFGWAVVAVVDVATTENSNKTMLCERIHLLRRVFNEHSACKQCACLFNYYSVHSFILNNSQFYHSLEFILFFIYSSNCFIFIFNFQVAKMMTVAVLKAVWEVYRDRLDWAKSNVKLEQHSLIIRLISLLLLKKMLLFFSIKISRNNVQKASLYWR